MNALQVTTPRDYTIIDLPMPRPRPGEALLRIQAVTTCPQWDLHLRRNEPMFVGHRFHYPYTPGQPGHEANGIVEAVGPGVTDLAVGDRASAWRDVGHQVPGCYAQYVVHRSENLIHVPDGPPDWALAPVELAMCVGTVFRTLGSMDALRGRTVGICGLGPAGLTALQMAHAEGAARIYGFDPLAARRSLAVGLGADECFDPGDDPDGRFPVRPARGLLDTAIDCVGSAMSVGFLMDRTADVIALFGVQREDYAYGVRHHTLTLCGYKGHSRPSAEYAVDLITAGKLDLAPLVTHRMPLSRYGHAVDLLERQEAIKVGLLPWG